MYCCVHFAPIGYASFQAGASNNCCQKKNHTYHLSDSPASSVAAGELPIGCASYKTSHLLIKYLIATVQVVLVIEQQGLPAPFTVWLVGDIYRSIPQISDKSHTNISFLS
jgi:hypothetical protein